MGFFKSKQESLNHRLFKALDRRNMVRIKAAVEAGADVNAMSKGYVYSAIYKATQEEHGEGALYLLEKGADPNIGCGDRTVLMEACYDGSYAIAEAVLKKGVDVNAKDSDGETAMHKAAKRGRANIIRLLQEYGGDKNVTNNRMNTPADLAGKEYPRVADMLGARERTVETAEIQARIAPVRVVEDEAGWRLTAQDEVANIVVRADIGYRLTEIFNFTTETYTRIAQNIQTGAESQTLKFFDECRDAVLLQRAQTALTQLGGHMAEPASHAMAKPAMQWPKPKGSA